MGDYAKFGAWLRQGAAADHSYCKWGALEALEREEWYNTRYTKAQKVAKEALQGLKAAETAAARTKILTGLGKALSKLAFVGAGVALLANVGEVAAGEKPVVVGIHDAVNMFLTAEDLAMLIGLEKAWYDEWKAESRISIGIHDQWQKTRNPNVPVPPGERPLRNEK